jgi:hypothetical protein
VPQGSFFLDVAKPALLPGTATAALGIAFSLAAGRSRRAPWISGITVAIGFVLGFALVEKRLAVPPRQAHEWIPVLVLVAALLFATRPRPALRLLARVVVLAGAFAVLLHRLIPRWTGEEILARLGVAGAAGLVAWIVLDRLYREAPPAPAALALMLTMSGAAFANLLAGSARLGQQAGALASALGGATAVAILFPSRTLGSSALAAAMTGLFAFLVAGRFLSYLPTSSAAALLATPIMAGFVSRRRAADRGRWKALALAGIAAAIPAGIGVWLAVPPPE